MRRFSQRSYLVTLSEINITPLLDLAFVLLIIFVITTPLLEQSINLKLPRGGQPEQIREQTRRPHRRSQQHGRLCARPAADGVWTRLIARLAAEFRANPNLIVYIRADKDGPYKNVAAVIDGCQRNGITRYSLRTEPTK